MTLSDMAANAAADAVCGLLNGGFLRIFDQGNLLAELRFGSPAFGPAVSGVAIAKPLTDEGSAVGNGLASTFRALTAYGKVVFDGTVGTHTEADMILDSTTIMKDAIVSITALTYQQQKT